MDDRDAVAHDMERIFGTAERPRVARADAAGLFAARRGHAAAWLAVAIAATGIVAVGTDRLRAPAIQPAAPQVARSSPPIRPPVAPRKEPRVAPAIRNHPPITDKPDTDQPATDQPVRSIRVRRPAPAPTIRPMRPIPPSQPARLEAPHLTGEALRRALAADVILTRRLNQQALERDTPPAD